MSKWTHVNGSIRIDASQEWTPIENIKNIFGEILKFKDGEEKINADTSLPCGSNGSLEYKIWTNPDKSDFTAYNILIWGDLQDYDNADEIEKWFNDILYYHQLIIRQAVLQIKVEGKESKILTIN